MCSLKNNEFVWFRKILLLRAQRALGVRAQSKALRLIRNSRFLAGITVYPKLALNKFYPLFIMKIATEEVAFIMKNIQILDLEPSGLFSKYSIFSSPSFRQASRRRR